MKRRRERGATLVESAIVFPLLFLTIFAIVEFGLAFKDWLTVSHAAREGARSGATFGNDVAADYLILTDVGRHLDAAAITIEEVRIYNAITGAGRDYNYAPGTGCVGSDCCDWSPCPNPDFPTPPYSPNLVWPPSSRDVAAPDTDTLGVEVIYIHQWVTNFFFDSSEFTSIVEYHLEPQIFDTDG